MGTNRPTIAVVDDEAEIITLYERWLDTEYTVVTATNGEMALELLDDEVDVVLLDRRMPGLSGDDVLDEIRARGLDCRVAMITAIEPDVDIIELGFDDYVVKPLSRDKLLETVEELLSIQRYDDTLQEYFSLASRIATLQSRIATDTLEDHPEYRSLRDRFREVRQAARSQLDESIDSGDFENQFRRLSKDWDTSHAQEAFYD